MAKLRIPFQGENPYVLGLKFKMFMWTRDFSVDEEFDILPLWIKFKHFSLDCFNHVNLEAIGSELGYFVCIDKNTYYLRITSYPCICVEMYVTNLPEEICLDIPDHDAFFQEITYDDFLYCSHCRMARHSLDKYKKYKGKAFVN